MNGKQHTIGLLAAAALFAGCEPIPELTYRGAADATATPGSAPDLDAGANSDNGLESQIAVIIDGDDAGDLVSDNATRQRVYDRVCKDRPATKPFCCDNDVLCAGRRQPCLLVCDTCATQCAGSLCCILQHGAIDHCSSSKKECTQAFKAARDR